MADERQRVVAELLAVREALVRGAELGAARARRTPDPILRARWLAIAAARAEFRDRVAARLMNLHPGALAGGAASNTVPAGEVARLLRAELALSHALSARCRRVARLSSTLGDAETGALLERIALEGLGHAAELARALALHYAREARAAAQ